MKVNVQLLRENLLEVAGRICVDELEEREEEQPLVPVWPLLSPVLKVVATALDEHPSLPYDVGLLLSKDFSQIDVVLYGESFFSPPLVDRRSFELTTFLAVATTHRKLAFVFDGQLVDVNLEQVFPGQ